MRSLTVFAALIASVCSLDASVWTFDSAGKGPSISPDNARIVLAHRLGLSRYHKIGNADERTLKQLNNAQSPLFSVSEASRKLMLIVEGLGDDLLESTASFTISNPPSTESNEKLVSDLLLQDMHKRNAAPCGKHEQNRIITGGFSANDPAGLCMVGPDEEHDRRPVLEQLEVLKGDSASMANLVYGHALPPSITSDYTAIFHVKALEHIASKQGEKSSEYKKALSAIRNTIHEAQRSNLFDQLIVVGMPSQPRIAKRDSYGAYDMPLQLRKEQPLTASIATQTAVLPQATSSSNRTIPKTTISVCWSSESACKQNTADCSGHGSCIKKYSEKVSDDETGAECWACACTPTHIEQAQGKKTIYWGGPACQKKDISVPFLLFAGFTIAAIAALSYGVGLLYSIGEEDLPSVLGAGVAPPTRK